ALARDLLPHEVGERLVADHEHVRLEDGDLGPPIGDARRHLPEVLLGAIDGGEEAADLALDLVGRHGSMRARGRRRAEAHRLADGHPRRAGDSLERLRPGGEAGGHSSSPKRSATSSPIARTASADPSPRARTSMTVPWEPHRRSTPMTLLAFAACP